VPHVLALIKIRNLVLISLDKKIRVNFSPPLAFAPPWDYFFFLCFAILQSTGKKSLDKGCFSFAFPLLLPFPLLLSIAMQRQKAKQTQKAKAKGPIKGLRRLEQRRIRSG